MDAGGLRAAFGCFPSGVTALCALVDGGPVGMAVSAFTSVSLDPPLIAVCVQGTSRTWPKLRSAPAIGVSVLAGHHGPLCRQLSGPGDRFAGAEWTFAESGAILVPDSPARFDCVPHTEVPAGDHTLALLRVTGLGYRPADPPLVFHGSAFRQLA
jgi:flavin reductase (DIM6/NTAB) family NADH-FMN oxidoreductase RutF